MKTNTYDVYGEKTMIEEKISLREVTEETLDAILRLDVHDNQRSFVAPNAVSIAQAHFSR
jgi:diamine N-acetyltransferase